MMLDQLKISFQTLRQTQKKGLIVLLDPDATDRATFPSLLEQCQKNNIFAFFIGGSHLIADDTQWLIQHIKPTGIPTLIFPHSSFHLQAKADGFLLLSLLSGRNPDYLIGHQVTAAPFLKKSGMEVVSTSYILVGNDSQTTAAYMSQTQPIPSSKPKIVTSTALAGELLGHHLTYLDAGSGARQPVPGEAIRMVRDQVSLPLVVGGGLNTPLKIFDALQQGADAVVIGNAIEQNPTFLTEAAEVIHQFNLNIFLAS